MHDALYTFIEDAQKRYQKLANRADEALSRRRESG